MIGKYLKEVRKARGLTQDELAKLTGISASSIKQWELDNTDPNARGLMTLAEVLDCSIDFLVGRIPTFKFEEPEKDIEAEIQRYGDYLRGINDVSRNSPKI